MSALKICPTCGAEYPANERFCPRDGSALRVQGEGGDLIGSVIADRYHVLRKLGEGGMGQVYLAEHVKMGRKSAVKVMSPSSVKDADAISRFNREASNASRINHPNVAGIYDFGETPDGLVYLAMEYVDGEPLSALIAREGALPPLRAAELVRQAGEALTVAHEMGIVHRDLKPDNLMVGKNRDGSDCVKIVDFGIAKAAAGGPAAGRSGQTVTKTGLVVGTPEYMSPEQLAGDAVDARSDVYSLGLVAFHALTGALPFVSETAQEAMIMRLTAKPRSLAEARPEVAWTRRVQEVLDAALARDPKARLASAAELGRSLRAAVEEMLGGAAGASSAEGTLVMGATVPATRVGPATMLPQVRRGRMPLLYGASVIVAALAAWVLFMSRRQQAREAATTSSARDSAVVEAAADSSSGVGPARASTAPRPPEEGANVAARLPILLSRSTEDATARDAAAEAERLMPTARGSERVGLALVQASALGLRNDTGRACPILRRIAPAARGTRYGPRVEYLRKTSC